MTDLSRIPKAKVRRADHLWTMNVSPNVLLNQSYDSIGGVHLTPAGNTMTERAGKFFARSPYSAGNNAGSAERFSIPPTNLIGNGGAQAKRWFNAVSNDTTSSFSVCAWVKLSALVSVHGGGTYWGLIFGKGGSAQFLLYVSVADKLEWYSASTTANAIATSVGSIAADTWYFVAGGIDIAGGAVWVSLNAATKVTTAHTTGTRTDGADAVAVLGGPAGVNALPGQVELLQVWNNYVLTATDLTKLYNGGSGAIAI